MCFGITQSFYGIAQVITMRYLHSFAFLKGQGDVFKTFFTVIFFLHCYAKNYRKEHEIAQYPYSDKGISKNEKHTC
jgi:hypothetical protein